MSLQTAQSSVVERVRNLLVGDRIVYLCDKHARTLEKYDLDSVEALRAILREADGQRSLVTRRSPLDRRAFPPRPEGRRRSQGRRSSDETH